MSRARDGSFVGNRQTVRSWAAYALLPLVGIATAPILARALGAEGRGELAAMLQPLTIASAIAVGGLPAAVTHYVGKGYGSRAVSLGAIVALVTTTVTALALIFYSGLVADNLELPRHVLLILWLAFLPSAVLAVRRAQLQGHGVMGPLDMERALGAVLRLLAVVALFLAGSSDSAAYGFAYMLAGLAAACPILRRRVLPVTPVRDAEAIFSTRAFIFFASIASLGTIAGSLNNRLDQALLPALSSAAELGYYSAAVAVAEAPLVISVVVSRNVLAAASQGRDDRTVVRSVMRGAAVVAVGCLCLAGLAPFAVPWVFGSEFGSAVSAVVVLLGATVFQYFSESCNAYLIGRGRPALASMNASVGVGVLLLSYGSLGAGVTAFEAAIIALIGQGSCALIAASEVLLVMPRRSIEEQGVQ